MADLEDKLAMLRSQIDKIDREILNLIIQRFELVKKISLEKKKRNISVVDRARESQILNNIARMAKEKGHEGDLLKKIFQAIIKSTREFELKLVNKRK